MTDDKDSQPQDFDIELSNGKTVKVDLDLKEWIVVTFIIIVLGTFGLLGLNLAIKGGLV